MTNEPEILLAAGIPIAVLVAMATLLVRRRRSSTTDEAPPTAEVPAAPPAPDVETTAEAPTPAVDVLPAEIEAPPALEVPAPVAGRLSRLRGRLSRSGSPLGARLLAVLSKDHLTEDDWDELEETLLLADVGAGPTS